MKFILLLLCLLTLSLNGNTQHLNDGKNKLQNKSEINENFSELKEERTAFSRKYKNKNGKKVSAFADYPLNYLDQNGSWQPISYRFQKIENSANSYAYPVEQPNFIFNGDINQSRLKIEGEWLLFSNRKIRLNNKNGELISENLTTISSLEVGEKELFVSNIDKNIDLSINVGSKFIKTNYILRQKPEDLEDDGQLLIEEHIELPKDWTIRTANGKLAEEKDLVYGELYIFNKKGQSVALLGRPIFSDNSITGSSTIEMNGVSRPAPKASQEKRNEAMFQGAYNIGKTKDGYKISIVVPNNWLMDEKRMYPITIDPVVVVQNNNVLNTCFFPNYESDIIPVNIPIGDTITSSFISWDFVAVSGTQAWMEDQRSYISSVNGATQVFQGTGSTQGTQNYSTTTTIANCESPGTVDFEFFASRVWGGTTCNSNFNFISERYIEVTHFEEITFGPGPIIVNEYSASNRTWTDAYDNYEDWVELYNPTTDFVNIEGYFLSDDENNPTKWEFPPAVIAPGEHLIVICSGRDGVFNGVPHAGFRLSQLKPEFIVLSEPNGTVLESQQLFLTQVNHSYGRTSDGSSDWSIFTSPTPGTSNINPYPSYTNTPIFDINAGFYANTITVQLTGNAANEEIRYTTNGNEPTISSTLYTGPITIENTTVIRARCFDTNGNALPGFIETNTYFIEEDFTLPVFSFSGDQLLTLFNGTQIEPRGGVEFFDKNGLLIDESYCDFDKHGNDSWAYPQRGVDFVSRDEFGYNAELSADFFVTKNRGDFQRLMVKAAANDNYPFEGGGAHIRDSYIQSLSQLTDLEMDERSSTNCIVFINGEYWGVYDLREKVDDKDFTRHYYDQRRQYKGSEEYIQFIKTWGSTLAKYGEAQAIQDWQATRNFILNNNMGNPANFAIADSLYDIQSMIDYMVINSFIVSRDWLNYNTGWWRGLNQNGEAKKWKYILWDTEAAFGHYINWTGLPDPSVNAPVCQVENLTVGDGHVAILNKFMNENPQVRQQYITRYADLLNTKFSCTNLIEILDSMVAVIEPEMPLQVEKWGGTVQEWSDNVETLREWINERCDVVLNSLLNCYNLTGPYDVVFEVSPAGAGKIKMNSEWLNSYPFDAFVYGNIETLLKAEGIGQFQFSHWELNNHTMLPGVNIDDVSLEVNQIDTIRAVFYDPNDTGNELLYYWHFNDLNTSSGDVSEIPADYKLLANTDPVMKYTGTGGRDIDEYQHGSELNLHLFESSGKAARVRNPSVNRTLEFNMPTDGYQNMVFEYAVHRSGSGMLYHEISYSTDGINFITTDLQQTTFIITENYQVNTIDFTGITAVDNNPNFIVKITFNGNTNQSNGNNRFDNITLKGDVYPLSVSGVDFDPEVIIFPNPFQSSFNIKANFIVESVSVTDPTGRLIDKQDVRNNNFSIDLPQLVKGIYLVTMEANGRKLTKRVVKY